MTRYPAWLLPGCLLLACVLVPLRLSGAGTNVHYLLDPDEPVLAEPALQMAKGVPFPRRLIVHPGSTTVLCLAVAYRLFYHAGRLTGDWSNWDQFYRYLQLQSGVLLYLGRLVCGVAGVGVTVALVLLLYRLRFSQGVCLAGGVLHGLSSLYLSYSHHIRPDFFQTLLILLALLAALNILERGRIRDYVLAGALGGLATASKYPAFVIFLTVPAAHLLAGYSYRISAGADEVRRRRITSLLLSGAGLALLVHGLTWQHRWLEVPPFDAMPPEWRDGADFLKQSLVLVGASLLGLAVLASLRSRLEGAILGLLWDRRPYLAAAAGLIAFAMVTPDIWIRFEWTLQCLVYSAKSCHPRASGSPGIGNLLWYLNGPLREDLGVIPVFLAAVCLLGVLRSTSPQTWLVALVPVVYLSLMIVGRLRFERYAVPISPWIAIGSVALLSRLSRAVGRSRATFCLLFAMVVAPAAFTLVGNFARQQLPDARTAATRWFEANVSPGSRVLLEERALQLDERRYRVREVLSIALCQTLLFSGEFDHIVTCVGTQREEAWQPVYERLKHSHRQVKVFSSESGEYQGPEVIIYEGSPSAGRHQRP